MDTGPSQCLLAVLVFSLVLQGAMAAGGGGYKYRISSGQTTVPRHDYRDALSKSILFFEGQRSGKLPPNQRLNWRKDSALRDGSAANVDLVGGYYDAGDNLKFGFPMAFTTTMLAWSVLEFGKFMHEELDNAKSSIRWATDYFLKAAAYPDTLYVQVGEPYADHDCWERPEDMDTPRTVYKITKDNPGTEVAAETAAALAAASIVFRTSDIQYSQQLLQTAVRLFEFADKYRGSYSDDPSVKPAVCPFYCDYDGYQDELLWGATWLHKATRNKAYLQYIVANGLSLGADQTLYEFGWDNKHAGINVLLAKKVLMANVTSLQNYKGYADDFICSVLPESPNTLHQYTPGGLIYKEGGSNMQRVTASSFLLLSYANYLSHTSQIVQCGSVTITPDRLRSVAKRQVDYILGDNPLSLSYMVGYGLRFPQYIHHRGSSLPSVANYPYHISCNGGSSLFADRSPNPNLLVGAVVGGPDINDQYQDSRALFVQSEPTTYINAPLVGLLAYFRAHPNY